MVGSSQKTVELEGRMCVCFLLTPGELQVPFVVQAETWLPVRVNHECKSQVAMLQF